MILRLTSARNGATGFRIEIDRVRSSQRANRNEPSESRENRRCLGHVETIVISGGPRIRVRQRNLDEFTRQAFKLLYRRWTEAHLG